MTEVASPQKLSQLVGTTKATDISVMFQKGCFGEKSVAEKTGGMIELCDAVNLEGISVANPSAEECANDSKTASNNCYFVGTRLQFYLFAFVGGLIGLGVYFEYYVLGSQKKVFVMVGTGHCIFQLHIVVHQARGASTESV
jgi:hypothetical protein